MKFSPTLLQSPNSTCMFIVSTLLVAYIQKREQPSWNPEVYEDKAFTLDHVRQRITCDCVTITLIPEGDVNLTDNTVQDVDTK